MLPYNEGRAKRLGLYGTSPFFSDPASSQPVNPTGPAQNRSWELTVSALRLSVQATVPATCGILLLSLIWFLGFCSHLPPFDLKYLNQIILFFPLKTVSGLPAPMPMQSRDVILLVRDQFPACSFHYLHCLLFLFLSPWSSFLPWGLCTYCSFHLGLDFSVFVWRSLFQCHLLKEVISGHPV